MKDLWIKIITALRIWNLKRQLRHHWYGYTHTFVGGEGHAISEALSPKKRHHKRKFNELAKRLEKLDPTFPKDQQI